MKKVFALLLMLVLALGVSVQAAEPVLDADAAVIVNAVTGERYYELNPTLEHAMASTTKVMVAILSLELVENYDGPQELRSRTLPAIESDLPQSGDSVMDLVLGEQLTIYDAVRGLMLPSGNDAARLLARTFGKGSYNAFTEMMNLKAAELGCTQTCFTTQSGLDSVGHYTTAADYAKIVNYAMGNPRFRELVATANYIIEAEPEYGVVRHELENSNRLLPDSLKLPDYSYEGVTGVKTGTTSNAGSCIMVSAEKDGTSLIISLLGAPIGTPKDEGEPNRYTEATKLLDYGFEVAAAQPYTVTAEGNTLTATNPATGYVMTATISASDAAYTGSAVETAVVTTTYPDGINWCTNWDVTYTNNDKVGTATASISFGGKTASCEFEIVEPVVTLMEGMSVDTLIVPAGQTYDLNGKILMVDKALTVNKGGKIKGGMLYVSKDVLAVTMGDNGGWIPVWSGESENYDIYDFYSADIKAGKSVISSDEGTKYSFGYKLTENTSEFSPYTDAIAAGDKIKFGVELTLDGAAVDYSFSQASIAKMEGINASAASDEFFKVNLNLVGVNNDLTKVRVAPVVKVSALGFRYVGEATGEGSGEYVARINTQGYYTLEDAVAAAAATGENTYIKIVDDIDFKRPVTLALNGHIRFIVNARANVTVSGPVTFDGQSDNGVEADGLLFRVYGRGGLTLKDGVVIRDHNSIRNAADNYSFGAAIRVDGVCELTLDDVTIENCAGAVRGAIYVSGTSKVDIRNSTFKDNTATRQYGGAIAIYGGESVHVENCAFDGNTAATYGGAIGISGETNEAIVTLKNNSYTDNVCSTSYYGGAIGIGTYYRGVLTVDGGSFSGNSIDDIGKAKGEIVLEGEIKGLEDIYLTAYEYVTVGETLAMAETASVTVNGSVTLSGSEVNAGKYITEDGMRTTIPDYIVTVGDARYETLTAAIEATKNATSATVIELYGNETVAEATTVTLNPNVQIKVTADSVISGPLTIDGAGEAHTAAVPIVVDGCELKLQNGATLKNIVSTFKETDDYHGILRIQNGGTLTLDGATVTGCKAPYGVLGGRNYPIINLNNATLSNNESTGSGGAIFAYGTTVNATNTVFDGNKSGGRSGAIHIGSSSSKLTMTGCTFKNNTATNAGGAICFYSKATGNTFTNCTFANNTAGDKGGAICFSAAAKDNVFTNCTFTNNVAGKQGGAVCIYAAAEVSFDGVTMSGNKANSTTANGISYIAGSLSLAGAIDIDYIAMNSGLTITLDAPATFARTVTVSGPAANVATFTGSKVADYYTYFAHKTSTLTFDASGKCVSK